MNVREHVAGVREAYMAWYREVLGQAKQKGVFVDAEVLLTGKGGEEGPSEVCIDMLTEEAGNQQAHMIAGVDGSEEGPLVGALPVGAVEAAVFPFRWESCVVWARGMAWDGVQQWFKKWRDRTDKEADETGLWGVVHYVSSPVREGAGTLFEVDFGSAPLQAFEELLQTLVSGGATEIRVGRSDGSEMDSELAARLRAPELTKEELMAVMIELLRMQETADRIERGAGDMELVLWQEGKKDPAHAHLENLWRRLQRVPPEARVREVMMQARAYGDLFVEEEKPDLNQLLPAIKDDQFMEQVKGQQALAARRLVADLRVAYVWDSATGMRFVHAAEPETYGLSLEQTHARAMKNYLALRNPVEIEQQGAVTVARTGDCYDATLLLDDAFWNEQAGKVEGELLACVPWRNSVLFTSTGRQDGEAQLRKLAWQIEQSGDHLVSQTVLRWTPEGWVLHPRQKAMIGGPRNTPARTRGKPWWKFW